MQPITPVIPGLFLPVTTFAKDQPEYNPLPALDCNDLEGTVITRWRLTWWERFQIFLTGDLWLSVLTFHRPLQPVRLSTTCPVVTQTERNDEDIYAQADA
jgi:hypothetical protein